MSKQKDVYKSKENHIHICIQIILMNHWKKVPIKINKNISKLKYKYVKIVLKNTLKLHKKIL